MEKNLALPINLLIIVLAVIEIDISLGYANDMYENYYRIQDCWKCIFSMYGA